ncbi:Alpha-2-macroglobulin receptor-associated protein [Camelus dromedarius]|uniref:Alpha-2-macroglobulin receptor-associated protein n=1 Tax=Camelus dromedarius TaxID=9838 RepID=A0A5N4EB32_CAMDR|nr:Alpha-2-macroglobulin receptor-associated protein [Camelus dromedarius]
MVCCCFKIIIALRLHCFKTITTLREDGATDEFKREKLKAEGLDKDQEKEAKLIRSLKVTLANYGLGGRNDVWRRAATSLHPRQQDDSLDGPQLEELWHKAKTSGKVFIEELDRMWREFQHHREKVQEHNIPPETLSRTEEIHKTSSAPPT